MTRDREPWACAAPVQATHREGAIAFVADRLAALAQARRRGRHKNMAGDR
jgi:hypothetical protein